MLRSRECRGHPLLRAARPALPPLPPRLASFFALPFAFLLALLPSPQAAAEEGPGPQLPAVTVSAGRGSALQDLDVSTTVIDRDEVRQAPQATTEQLVNRIPGVFTLNQPGGQMHPTAQVFSIRGFGTTTNVNTLVMVDGVPVNDPFFRTVDWGQIPKESTERIEVIRGGGATSLWGNLAMGGVVNIVTREPQPGERRVSASYGSFDSSTLDGAVTLLANDRLRLGLDAGLASSDGYWQVPAQFRNPYMATTTSRADNLSLGAVFTPSPASRYYLKAIAHRSQEHGLVWSIAGNEWHNHRIVAGGTTRLDAGGSVNLAAWLGRAGMDTTNAGQTPAFSIFAPQAGVPFVSQVEQARYRSAGGSAFYQRDIGTLKDLKIGLDLRTIKADDTLDLFGPAAQTAAIVARGEHRFAGVFAQGTWRPEKTPLDVTVGLRQDYWQAANAGVEGIILSSGSLLSNPLADTRYHRFDPRIGLRYFATPELIVRAAAYRNFAAPGMNQMYRSFVSGTSYTATNPDLVPQTNVGKEIGLDYARAGLDLSLTLFDNALEHFIDFAPLCTTAAACNPLIAGTGLAANSVTRVNQYVNAGSAVFRGAEVLGRYRAGDALQFSAGFTRTQAYLTKSAYTTPAATPPDPVNKQIGQVPKWIATLGATWKATPALTVGAQLKSFPAYWNNTAHTQRNDGATLVDVGASYRLGKTVELWGSIQNLFDRRYDDQGLTYTTIEGSTVSSSGIPALGIPRWVTVGVRTSF